MQAGIIHGELNVLLVLGEILVSFFVLGEGSVSGVQEFPESLKRQGLCIAKWKHAHQLRNVDSDVFTS